VTRLAKAADAVLDVSLQLYRPWSRERDKEALEVLEEALVVELGVTRLAAVRALTEALVRRTRAA
jgi:hypothetical protein